MNDNRSSTNGNYVNSPFSFGMCLAITMPYEKEYTPTIFLIINGNIHAFLISFINMHFMLSVHVTRTPYDVGCPFFFACVCTFSRALVLFLIARSRSWLCRFECIAFDAWILYCCPDHWVNWSSRPRTMRWARNGAAIPFSHANRLWILGFHNDHREHRDGILATKLSSARYV